MLASHSLESNEKVDPEIAACQFLLLGVIALPLVVIAGGWAIRSRARVNQRQLA